MSFKANEVFAKTGFCESTRKYNHLVSLKPSEKPVNSGLFGHTKSTDLQKVRTTVEGNEVNEF